MLLSSAAPMKAAILSADSAERRWSVEAGYMPEWQIPLDSYTRDWLRNRRSTNFHLEAGYTPLPQDSDAFARDYNYPSLSLGVALHLSQITLNRDDSRNDKADYDSRVGNGISIYGKFARPIFRYRRWSAGYALGFGVAWHEKKYNKRTNVDDVLIGSRWSMYFASELYAGYRFARDWTLKAGVAYFHHSNGALNRPNKGSNNLGPIVALAWTPAEETIEQNARIFHSPPFHRYFYSTFMLGVGGKTFDSEWRRTQYKIDKDNPEYRTQNFHVSPVYELQTAFMYRYARRWASGIAVDAAYLDQSGTSGQIAAYDRWSVGLAAQHEVFYHNLSVRLALGYYLHHDKAERRGELEYNYYENIGVFYTFPHFIGLKVGINVKAHYTKADYSSLRIVVPVWYSE